MSAKLARLEQQEAEFMAKYGKKSQPGSVTSQLAVEESSLRGKGKSAGGADELNDTVPENPEMDIKPKKKKKKKRRDEDADEEMAESGGDVMRVENSDGDLSDKTKGRKKNKAQKEEESASSPADASGSPVETAEFVSKKKKKKKKRKSQLQCDVAAEEEAEETESNHAEPTQDRPLEGKRKSSGVLLEAADVGESEVTVKQKRKKCKKDKARDGTDEKEAPPKKKKKKKSKE